MIAGIVHAWAFWLTPVAGVLVHCGVQARRQCTQEWRAARLGRERERVCARCPHLEIAHEHYRRGTPCGLCACSEFIHRDVAAARSAAAFGGAR